MRTALAFCLAACLASAATHPEEISPKLSAPFIQPAEAERAELHAALKAYMAQAPGSFGAHPAAKDFPGLVTAADRVAVAVGYDSNLITRWDTSAGNAPNLATVADAWQETGLYAAPGEVVTIKADSIPPDRTVRIIVGCHRDSLLKLDKWQRFPLITRSFDLAVGENKVANPFGGQLFIQVAHKDWRKPVARTVPATPLRFANAVASPTYVLGKDSAESWMKSLRDPAPWATLVGKQVILHVQASEARKLADPKPLLEWWDKVMELEDDLVGLHRLAPERVVPDRQISAGFMHSGYPFMCILGSSQKDIIDLSKLRKDGEWGFFHELGHNHQRRDWTFENQTEVTCNLFSLYVMQHHVGKPVGTGHPALKDLPAVLAKRFAEPEKPGPFEQLATFIVLLKAHGWAPLRETLRSYGTQPAPKKATVPELKNLFVERYGVAAKADVSDYFALLGYPVSETTRAKLKAYPPFKPDLPSPAK